MKKGASPKFLSIAFIVVIVLMISIIVFGVFYILSDKDDGNGNSAVNETSVNDTIYVDVSGFAECMVFSVPNKAYTLADSFDATVQGRDSCLEVTADNVLIDLNGNSINGNMEIDYGLKGGSVKGFKIINGEISDFVRSNMFIENNSEMTVKNMELSHGDDGMLVVNSSKLNLENVTVKGALNRNVYFRDVNDSNINHLELSESSAGIVIYNSYQNKFNEIFSYDNTRSNMKPSERAGILLIDSDNNEFTKTEAINNTGMGQSGVLLIHSSFNSFTDFISEGNGFAGLYFEINQDIQGSNDNSVDGSVEILKNNVGLYIRASYNNSIDGVICNSTTRADIACESGNTNNIGGIFDTVNHLCFDTNNTITSIGECANYTSRIKYFDNGLR